MADNAVQTKDAISSRVEADSDVIVITIFGRSADGGRLDDSQRQAAEAGAKRAMNAVDAEYQASSSLLFNALSEGKAALLHATLTELEGDPTEEPTETEAEE